MYLKSIEIHGFKSFANKMLFEFHDGITAIVGPNGSGKSNVSDAVRWVLGEQSAKQLRGTKMEDVIFSGTETRRPLGFAYVAITLDNSDHKLATAYEEVTVARRVYRSGESEYLMNGTACRLKDVQELFMDTGIGKEGYSIIGQGQIDKILSGKPEERRELFDEAAGIVKYKRRKVIAEKNLEQERQNLCRIRDIISEIEKQVEPLQRQSEVAKQYLNFRDELKTLDVNLFFKEYDHIKGEIKSASEKDKIATDELEDAKKTFESMREKYDKLEQEINEYSTKLEELKNNLSDSKIRKEQIEGKIRVLNEQIIAVKQREEHFLERNEQLDKQILEKAAEAKKEEEKLLDLKQVLEGKEQTVLEKKEELEKIREQVDTLTREMERSNREIVESVNETASLQSRIQHFELMLSQCNLKKTELTQRILKLKSSETVADETIDNETKNLEKIKDQITGYQNINEDIQLKSIDIQNKILATKTKQQEVMQKANMEHAKLTSLKNMTERYDGYGQSIRRVMEQKANVPGIVGVVADIIKVKKDYELAIEIALGGSIQNIVTDNENTAKQLIEFLKRNKYGRATFLPLTLVAGHGNFTYMDALKEKGVIGLASSLIEADKKYEGLVKHLLGRVVVVEHIDDAIALNRKYKSALRIVTLEGELLNPGGSMSGGAFKNTSNLLSRRREMEDMEKLLETYQKQLQKFTESIEALEQEKEEKQKKFKINQEKLQELFINRNTSKVRLEQAQNDKNNISSQYEGIHKESQEIDKQKEDWECSIVELRDKGEEADLRKLELEENIDKLRSTLEKSRKDETVYREKLSKMELDFTSFAQKENFIKENISRLEREQQKLREEKESLKAGQEDSKEQVKLKEQEILSYQDDVKKSEQNETELAKQISECEAKKDEINKDHKEIFTKRDEISNRMILLEREHSRLASQNERFHEQLDQLKNYMWEEYELTYNSAYSLKTLEDEVSVGALKKQINEIKMKIRSLGEVNVNAIEDYKNLSERYELLKTQHDDLVESEIALVDIIKELDEEMRKQFKEKFEEIRSEFDKAFKELFGGGKGTLELMEDEDVLTAGIRIIAQPPGKKLQNMMQLSGGEKALTAIALLFAIQNLKPSPFCLLDEIEAALDDSNVSRYANYLHKLTKHTQFIVITHRRGTMAAADVLYGITMQEKGVSTLVSVNLIESELEK